MSTAHRGGTSQPRSTPAAPIDGTASAQSLADVVETLCVSFNPRLARRTVIGVVRRCRRELEILTGPSRVDAIERVARRRLTALADARDAALHASPRRRL